MMTPSACLIVLFALLTVTGYLLWISDRLPRLRVLIGVLAVVTLVLAIVLYDLEVANVSSRERGADGGTAAIGTDASRTGS